VSPPIVIENGINPTHKLHSLSSTAVRDRILAAHASKRGQAVAVNQGPRDCGVQFVASCDGRTISWTAAKLYLQLHVLERPNDVREPVFRSQIGAAIVSPTCRRTGERLKRPPAVEIMPGDGAMHADPAGARPDQLRSVSTRPAADTLLHRLAASAPSRCGLNKRKCRRHRPAAQGVLLLGIAGLTNTTRKTAKRAGRGRHQSAKQALPE